MGGTLLLHRFMVAEVGKARRRGWCPRLLGSEQQNENHLQAVSGLNDEFTPRSHCLGSSFDPGLGGGGGHSVVVVEPGQGTWGP